MTVYVVAAPLAFALLTMSVRNLYARQTVRMLLAAVAALLPLTLAGKLDGLAAIFTALVSLLGFAATIFSTTTFSSKWEAAGEAWSSKPVYFVLLGAFWSAMLLAVVADNFATLWLGISATTLATAFLVGFSGEAAALEAAWKYLVLCSVGIGFALLGIIVLGHLTISSGIEPRDALSWAAIGAHHWRDARPPALARLATALMLVGFATKAGLVPMHAWLPDAHSKAPAPISALLSGVLVSCALYAIVRTLSIGAALGSAPLLHELLQWLGALSIVVAALLMLSQRDLKRFLAYSTVEHAGIVALALGFGGRLGLFAALLHIVAHAFTKAAAFFAAGLIQREHGTTQLSRLRALWDAGAAGRLLLGTLIALAGMPPFGLFVSEFLLVLAGVAAHAWLPLGIGLAGLALAFIAVARSALDIESGHVSTVAGPEHRRSFARVIFPRIAAGVVSAALLASVGMACLPWTPAGVRFERAALAIESPR
jgi:hydrogenase-4 component F